MKKKLKKGSYIVNSYTHELFRVTRVTKQTITAVPIVKCVIIKRPTTNWYLYNGAV